jgi:hypothetical protein
MSMELDSVNVCRLLYIAFFFSSIYMFLLLSKIKLNIYSFSFPSTAYLLYLHLPYTVLLLPIAFSRSAL